jgi:hypothetical protein
MTVFSTHGDSASSLLLAVPLRSLAMMVWDSARSVVNFSPRLTCELVNSSSCPPSWKAPSVETSTSILENTISLLSGPQRMQSAEAQ